MTFLHTKVRNYKQYIICSGFVVFISLLLCGAFSACGDVFAENLDYNVSIQPSLSVIIPSNTVELNINPVTTQFNSADLSVTVGTNNATGYTLTMSSDSTELSKAGSTDTIPTLETLAGGYPEADFAVNHWGYKLSTATNYLPFATSNELDVTDSPTNSKTSIVNFAAKADLSKPAGTYKLAIDFAAVANYVPPTPFSLYNSVAALSKGKNTDSSSHFSWTSVTTPTSTAADSTEDTSTSGVFEWDGQDSNNGSQKIYFYRGILETSAGTGTYGSDGSANAYPNYIMLANNTCWRIVRTTSTGGVKIIYNGTWKNNTCANTQAAAQLTGSPFNTDSATVSDATYNGLEHHNIHAVGYTYSSLAAGTTDTTAISTIFGSTGNDTTTNTNSSIIKQYLESWYHANMTDYTSKLEGNAGYCNDRSLYTSPSGDTPLADSTKIIPYGTTDNMTVYYFGPHLRNANQSTFSPTLTCPRGKVDLYSYTGNTGNGQLTYPVALLTADEVSLAGNGYGYDNDNSYNAYNAKSYLNSGSVFWLLSPDSRDSYGYARGFVVVSSGYLLYLSVNSIFGVRPVISLSSGTQVLGSGTATDPWVVQ
ncbi:hypothetical protein IJ101_01580 [Candidatus Saccharibacteria bacterium]|nr:hypothetical protein [Candidatus Saccharibacteria bacterium]